MGYVDYISSLSKPTCAPLVLSSDLDPDTDFSEAKYLENLVPGYRTTSVTGRESYESDITDMGMDVIDGDYLKRQRFKTRDISINYAIVTDTLEDYHNSYKILKKTLRENEEAKWIFTDAKENVFYKATASSMSNDQVDASGSGAYVGTGTITIHCTRPFAYSCKTYAAVNNGDTVSIDYDGTYKTFPVITSTAKSAHGWLLLFNDRSKILKFGDVEIDDTTPANRRITWSHGRSNESDFKTFYDKGDRSVTEAPGVGDMTVLPNYVSLGKPGPITNQQINGKENHTSYMSLYMPKKPAMSSIKTFWGGSAIRWTINPDNADAVADNFELDFQSALISQNGQQEGGHCIQVLDEDGNNIMGMSMYHCEIGTRTDCWFWIGTKTVGGVNNGNDHSSDKINKWNHWSSWKSLKKNGNTFTFNFNSPRSYTDATIGAKKAKYIQVTIYMPYSKDWQQLEVNAVSTIKFTGYGSGIVGNDIGSGDVVRMDTASGKVYKNNLFVPSFGAIGNDWEDFYLSPGVNRIKIETDSTTNPDVTVSYRKVFI